MAAWLDEPTREALERLPRPVEPGVRWVSPDRWHVTLRFFGHADPMAAATALDAVGHGPVIAALGPAVSRLGRSVLCVPVTGLDEVAETVRAATAHVGEPPDPRPFAGHVTLARLSRRGSCGLAGHKVSAKMALNEISLVASVAGHEGPTYTTLQRYPLV